MNKQPPILIIGAGLSGLITALGLQKYGFRVRVYEQSEELGEVGAGLTVGPNASRILDYLGVQEHLLDQRVVPEQGVTMHYETGETLHVSERGAYMRQTYGADYYFVHRADLHAQLCDMVRANDADSIHTSHRLDNVTQTETSVTAHFDNGDSATGSALIACDGIRSQTRSVLFDPAPPEFMGYVAWRGLVPRADLGDYPVEPAAALALGPERSFLRYLVRNRELINYVAISKADDWTVESWSEPSTIEELREHFGSWNQDVRRLIDATPPDGCFKWGLFARKPLTHWTQGRVTLAGDAAHPMLPFLGQGAAMALEDAMVLARAIANYDPIEKAFERYEAARKPRCSFIQEQSEIRGPEILGQRPEEYGKKGVVNEDSLGVFKYDATTVEI